MVEKISKRKPKKRLPGRPRADDALRERLMIAARKLFAEQGFDKTSTREIAAAAGGNIALISYYFGGKDELLLAILEAHAQRMRESMPEMSFDDIELDRETFLSILRGVFALQVASLQEEAEMLLLIEREFLSGVARTQSIIDGILQKMLEQMVGLLQRGKTLGFIREELHETTFLMLLARSISGYFFLHRQLIGKVKVASQIIAPNHEEFIQQLELTFLRGILR
jgi:AcrR family transcriptional regulator